MLALHFKELVEELEQSAQESQGAYKVKVAALAALGYVYVLIVIAFLGAALWMLWLAMKDGRHLALLKFAIPMALLALVGLRALWVRLDPPEGVAVTAGEAPQLFALLDKIRKRLKGPPIHRVVFDDAFNAAIMQLPRFGILGGSRNYLIIGLPLMQTLSVEQFAAVLAHEYGHLSGAHGHFASWIYRVRMVWARILDALVARPVWGSGAFLWFFRWYVPYFEAYTFVLARSNEYEADRAATDVAGARTMADALVQVDVGARFMEERFWPTYCAGADKSPAPAAPPYSQLPLSLNVGLEAAEAQAWLKSALLAKTGIADTHPCIKERIAALGETPRIPDKPATSAARALLGTRYNAILAGFDKDWTRRNMDGWKERHREAQSLRDRAAVISAKAKSGAALNADEWHAFGLACERFSSPTKAEGYYRRALEIAPAHADAHFALGEMLLRRRDAAGIAHLDKAIADGGGRAMEATSMAARFLREAGRDREAERYETRSMAQAAREEESEMDRVFLLPDDTYAPHGLTDKELSLCRATFKRLHRVFSVHAVKKILPGAGEPHLVLVVQQREGVVGIVSNIVLSTIGISPREDWSLADEVLDKLRLAIPFTVFIDLYLEDEIVARVRDVQDSLVFDDSDR